MTRELLVLSRALTPLTKLNQWVIWKWEQGKTGKMTKVPYQGRRPGRLAKTTDPQTWCSLNDAMAAYCDGNGDGIGFVLSGSEIAAVDLDHCRNASTGEIHPWARDLIDRCGSYVEITPSKEGLRIIGLATGDKLHRKFNVPDGNGAQCELYRKADRYITISANEVGSATELTNIDALLDDTLERLDGSAKRDANHEKPRTNGQGARRAHDLDSLIKDGCGDDFGGDRSRAVWYVINTLLKQGRPVDEIAALLLDRGNAISAHIYDQPKPEEYARKQVEKAQTEQAEEPDAEITRLAKLATLDYELQRLVAAEKLNVRASILDRLVAAERAKLGLDGGEDGLQGSAMSFEEIQSWSEAVDGAQLLDDLATAIRKHVVMADHERDIATFGTVHTYLIKYFKISPKLSIKSATKRCGKSTLLEVLAELVFRALVTGSITTAALFRVVDKYHPTLLIDEIDTFVGEDEERRGIINQSHRHDGAVVRTVGDEHEPRKFSVYAAVALSGIGGLADTLADRSITNNLKRRRANEPIEQLRIGRMGHLHAIRRRITRWVADHEQSIAGRDPEMQGIYNRDADNWMVLLAIADEAGDEWGKRARKAAEVARVEAGDDNASQTELLLGDIKAVFDEKKADQIASAELVKALIGIDGRPWAELGKARKPLSPNRLARMLKPLAIPPDTIRFGDETAKGYRLAAFQEAFERYLGSEGASQPSHRNKDDEMGTSDLFQTVTRDPNVTVEKCEKSNNDGLCYGVTVEKGENGAGARVHPLYGRRPKSDDLNYFGPVIPVPGHGPDPLDEHGAPLAAAAGPGDEPGLSRRRIDEIGDWYKDETHRRYSEGTLDVAELDAELRAILREEVDLPEHVEIEIGRVMQAAFR
jgi:hypothetical protein